MEDKVPQPFLSTQFNFYYVFFDEIYIESPEKVDYQLFSPFIANEAKQKYKKQAIIFFKGQIISEFYQRLNTHLPQNVWFLTEMPYFGVL